MQTGIFTKVFSRPSLAQVLDAVVEHGFHVAQFNWSCAGLDDMPDAIEPALIDVVREMFEARQISMAAVSGTYNMIDPNLQARRDGLRRLRVLAETAPRLGTSLITLCTGTRDPHDMWRWHPDNASEAAWDELVAEMREAVKIAEACGVSLGVEPEGSKVMADAHKARRLLDELGSPNLKIIMDGANLFQDGDFSHQQKRMDAAFALLHKDIVMAHAKDLVSDGKGGIVWRAAGQGSLDYRHYLKLLAQYAFAGPLVPHGLEESQVEACKAMLVKMSDV